MIDDVFFMASRSVLVNESHFSYNQDEAIEYLSCNISMHSQSPVNFSVAFSHFTANHRHAILMKPLLNTEGIITNCTFKNHTFGTLRIDNEFDLLISKWYREFPVNYRIFGNRSVFFAFFPYHFLSLFQCP